MNITDIADALDGAIRQGSAVDQPEGSRYAVLSDTVLKRMARDLRLAAAGRFETEEFGGRRAPGQERELR